MLELGKSFKKRLHENLVGTHISMSDSMSSEILGALGYDFIWIDTEHAQTDYVALRHHLTAVNAGGTPAIVRTAVNDFNHVKRIMEMGPQGIVFPMINTVKEAEDAVSFVSYPPRGIRGFGPQRAVRYGIDDMSEYIKSVDSATTLIAQIETVEAVENLEALCQVEGIDAFLFGPCDLSGTCGELNQVFNETTQSYMKKAIEILKKHGKPIGISTGSTDPEVQKYWFDMGINIISTGTDYHYLMHGARDNLAQMRRMFEGK